MELDWSEHAPHIRSLFRPWQPDEGYTEADIAEEEARLGVRVPAVLRNFYLAWGMRHDLTNMSVHLCRPENLSMNSGALIVYIEWGPSWYWAVRLEDVEDPNPPLFYGWPKRIRENTWMVMSDVEWQPCYARLSELLDELTYTHALIGGALHGGHSMEGVSNSEPTLKRFQKKWLERHWEPLSIKSVVSGNRPAPAQKSRLLYVRDGQALRWDEHSMAAVRDAAALDEIAFALQIKWFKRW